MGSLGPGSGMQASADSYGHTESAPTGEPPEMGFGLCAHNFSYYHIDHLTCLVHAWKTCEVLSEEL